MYINKFETRLLELPWCIYEYIISEEFYYTVEAFVIGKQDKCRVGIVVPFLL